MFLWDAFAIISYSYFSNGIIYIPDYFYMRIFAV